MEDVEKDQAAKNGKTEAAIWIGIADCPHPRKQKEKLAGTT